MTIKLKYCVRCNKPFFAERCKLTCSIQCSKELEHKTRLMSNRRRREYNKLWQRKNKLVTRIDGKIVWIRVIKREYPKNGKCELCGKIAKRLIYHHWKIENNKAYGLWICCGYCHGFAELVDKGLTQKYLKLKEKIEIEF